MSSSRNNSNKSGGLHNLMLCLGALLVLTTCTNILYHAHLPDEGLRSAVVAEAEWVSEKIISYAYQDEQEAPLDDPHKPTPPPQHPEPHDEEYKVPHTKLAPATESAFVVRQPRDLWQSSEQVQARLSKDGTKEVHRNIHNVTWKDIERQIDTPVSEMTDPDLTVAQASVGKEPLLQILHDAGVADLDAQIIAALPTWQQVTDLYGNGPVVYGLDRCEAFRAQTPLDDASVGVAGLFNSGTNPLAMYLSANCVMPHNTHDKGKGMRWQVPWGKHMLASKKWSNTAKRDRAVNKTNVMPVVAVRDPFSWMQSMCRHSYKARFIHNAHHCPVLVPTGHDMYDHDFYKELWRAKSVPVKVGYPYGHEDFDSLAHLWTRWVEEYVQADYPRLMVRFEDIIFHPRALVATICSCAGGRPKQENFQYVVAEAKWGKIHEGSSNMITAMIKYGKGEHRLDSLTTDDLNYADKHVNSDLMQLFQYRSVQIVDEE